jgi:hypothetical protein
MSQPKHYSLLEAFINVLVGFGIATTANYFVIPLFGYPVTLADSTSIGLIMTVISILRSYALRRAFNWWQWGRKWRRG